MRGLFLSPPDDDITRTLLEVADRRTRPTDRLLQLVYDELRELAVRHLDRERSNHTLQPTALVHEAYLRLVDETKIAWQGQAHFFAVAASAIRRILVDHARRKGAQKRGGDWKRMTIAAEAAAGGAHVVDLIALDDALSDLAAFDERKSRVVEMRYFGGLAMKQIAEVVGVSLPTVERDWASARAWLHTQLAGDDDGT